ncbi:MAG: type II toxin-antitoxin system RelE/ParE family toxin, partial [Actinomycetota bacterium]|nr:type II toxin-antitoxin system RelE/ParE family toxin [Actinomycetota bacterium]
PEKVVPALSELLDDLGRNPRRVGKPLRLELTGRWAARRGAYRVIYSIDGLAHRVIVESVRHRRTAYGHR